jgi:hypothetical protein
MNRKNITKTRQTQYSAAVFLYAKYTKILSHQTPNQALAAFKA